MLATAFDVGAFHRAQGLSVAFFPEVQITFNVRDPEQLTAAFKLAAGDVINLQSLDEGIRETVNWYLASADSSGDSSGDRVIDLTADQSAELADVLAIHRQDLA